MVLGLPLDTAPECHTYTASAPFATCSLPITGTMPKLLGTLHPLNPSSQVGTQQTAVRGFVSQSADGSQPLVDSSRARHRASSCIR
jgi:hypothetical protein